LINAINVADEDATYQKFTDNELRAFILSKFSINLADTYGFLVDRIIDRNVISSFREISAIEEPYTSITEQFGNDSGDSSFYEILANYFQSYGSVALADNLKEQKLTVTVEYQFNEGDPVVYDPLESGLVVFIDKTEFTSPEDYDRPYNAIYTNNKGLSAIELNSTKPTPYTVDYDVYAPGDFELKTPINSGTIEISGSVVEHTIQILNSPNFPNVVAYPSAYLVTNPNEPGDNNTITAKAPSGIFSGDQNVTIANLATLIDTDLPKNLKSIRYMGGLTFESGTGVQQNDVDIINSIAQLEVATSHVDQMFAMYTGGYTSLQSIANTDRTAFVASLTNQGGGNGTQRTPSAIEGNANVNYATIHNSAKAASEFLSNVVNGALRSRRSPAKTFNDPQNQTIGAAALSSVQNAINSALQNNCECQDCQSAVSPLAYLADLIRFKQQTVQKA